MFLILQFFFGSATSQKDAVCKVVVYDTNNIAISGATVSLQSNPIGITNNNGVLSIRKTNTPFNLKVTHISFESFSNVINTFLDSFKIILKPKKITSETVTIRNKKSITKRIGVTQGLITGNFHLQPNTALVVKIDATQYDKATLKEIHFNLTEDKYEDVNAPFKVLIYNNDSSCNCPGKMLLEDYIVQGAKKRKWFTVDVSKENIYIDREIIYVGLLTMPNSFYKERVLVKRGKKDIYPSFEFKLPALRMLSKKSETTAAFWKFNYDSKTSKWLADNFQFLVNATIVY